MEKKIWKKKIRSICPSPLILQEKLIVEIMATSKNYGEKKGSDHFRDILNPYGKKTIYGKIGRRYRLSKLNDFFFHNSFGYHNIKLKLFIIIYLFPTCQVRVIRFYQSCFPPPRLVIFLLLLYLLFLLFLASSPPPPPPISPRPYLHYFPPPLPASQLFAKLFANSLRQALCQFPSSIRTAGPQPGTFPAQCTPLDLNLGPSELSVHRWTSTWDLLIVHHWTST